MGWYKTKKFISSTHKSSRRFYLQENVVHNNCGSDSSSEGIELHILSDAPNQVFREIA